jgi:DNA processing protein
LPQVTHPASHQGDDRLAWLALTLAPGLGPKRILDAMKLIDVPSRIFHISLTELESLRFPAEAAQFIFDGKARQAAETEWTQVAEQGGTICTYGCSEYPERLKEIYDPPPVLWFAAPSNYWPARRLQSLARVIPRPTAQVLQRCWRAIWPRGAC